MEDTISVGARLPRELVDALSRWSTEQPEPYPSRSEAIRAILTDWLRTHGFGASDMPKLKGPATEVVEAMDAATKEHRGSRSARKL